MDGVERKHTLMLPGLQVAPALEPFLVVFDVFDISLGHVKGLNHSCFFASDLLHFQLILQAFIAAERELVDSC